MPICDVPACCWMLKAHASTATNQHAHTHTHTHTHTHARALLHKQKKKTNNSRCGPDVSVCKKKANCSQRSSHMLFYNERQHSNNIVVTVCGSSRLAIRLPPPSRITNALRMKHSTRASALSLCLLRVDPCCGNLHYFQMASRAVRARASTV